MPSRLTDHSPLGLFVQLKPVIQSSSEVTEDGSILHILKISMYNIERYKYRHRYSYIDILKNNSLRLIMLPIKSLD